MAIGSFNLEIFGNCVAVQAEQDVTTFDMRYAINEKEIRNLVKRLVKNGYTYAGYDAWKDLDNAIMVARIHIDQPTHVNCRCTPSVALKWRHPGQIPEIKKVIFNPPATIVMWEDGTKTVVKCRKGEEYSKEAGLAFCVMKKTYGSKFHRMFKDWCKE